VCGERRFWERIVREGGLSPQETGRDRGTEGRAKSVRVLLNWFWMLWLGLCLVHIFQFSVGYVGLIAICTCIFIQAVSR